MDPAEIGWGWGLTATKKKENLNSVFEKAEKLLSAAYPYGTMNFIPALAFYSQTANSCTT